MNNLLEAIKNSQYEDIKEEIKKIESIKENMNNSFENTLACRLINNKLTLK